MSADALRGPDFVRLHAGRRPDRTACVDLASGRSWTYAELHRSIGSCAGVLAKRGISTGARVATVAHNSAWLVILQQACCRVGAIFTPLNWRLAPAELDRLLEDCTPVLLVHDEASAPAIQSLTEAPPLVALAALAEEIDDTVVLDLEVGTADAPSILLYTSGTTGRCKGVVVTERNALFSALNFALLAQVDSGSVFLVDSPLFHVIGLLASVGSALMHGGTVLISNGFVPHLTNRRLADVDFGVTHYFCVPQMAQMLREDPGFDRAAFTRLTALFTGGAPNPADNVRRWLADGIRMVDGYGMTEAGTVLGMPIDDALLAAKAGASGLPGPAISIRLVDDAGQLVPTDAVGELQLKGPSVTSGYWRNASETAAAFTADGWFRTGDLGRSDQDGFVFLVDRKKDMFVSGGENVYPGEVERILTAHRDVMEAAVIGVPDARWGEVGCAFVVGSDESALIAYCAQHLARYKIPKRFQFVDALPRTTIGKVDKNALRLAADAGER